ncbi:peptidoglycan recognition protein family protein (plasmid) [Paenibacillus sp. S-38]|uniref:peptidoglycan recognition protein family protein n=1 Tax=Paenibacillus sp. S-38 TaxID=3416710 RepID=UPI003CF47BCA
MIPIQTLFIPKNQFSRPGTLLAAKRGIVMHYTASPRASALAIGKYFTGLKDQNPNDNVPDKYASAHIQVDRISKVQSIPFNERAYHCGSSKPYMKDAIAKLGSYPNNSTVGIEMCIEADGSIHEETFQNAVDVVVYLIQHEGFPEVIFTHKEVVGWKDCPLPWVKNPAELDRFKKAVRSRLHAVIVSAAPTPAPPIIPIPVPINPEEDEDMKLSDDQWTLLAKSLHELYVKKLITDYGWAEKAAARKLTVSELLFVNTVVLNRSIEA